MASAHLTSSFHSCGAEGVWVSGSEAPSYSQSPQRQQTPEGPRLHRTYQIVLQVPGGVRKLKVRHLLSV